MPEGTVKALMKKGMLLKVVIGLIVVSSISMTIFLGMDYVRAVLDKPFVLKENGDNKNYFTRVFPPICSLDELSLYNTGGYIYEQFYVDGSFIGQTRVISLFCGEVEGQLVICLCPSQEIDPYEYDTTDCIATRVENKQVAFANELLDDYIIRLNVQGKEVTRDDFAPRMLLVINQEDVEIRKYIFYGLGIIFAGILLIWLRRLIVFTNLKTYRGIRVACRRYGNLEEIFEKIEQEPWIYTYKGCYYNKEWLIDTKKKRIVKLEDVMWFCLRHSTGIFKNKIRAYFYMEDGRKYFIKFSNQDRTDFFVEEMKKIITCYSPYDSEEKYKEWKKNKHVIV